VTDPREPFDTDSDVEAIDLDDARFDERGTADIETGADQPGSAEGSSDTADQDTAGGAADVVPDVERGGRDALVGDPLAAPAPDHDPLVTETLAAAEEEDEDRPRRCARRCGQHPATGTSCTPTPATRTR
jgi:transcriptional antiterminator NusG